jgi:hypothetical protein
MGACGEPLGRSGGFRIRGGVPAPAATGLHLARILPALGQALRSGALCRASVHGDALSRFQSNEVALVLGCPATRSGDAGGFLAAPPHDSHPAIGIQNPGKGPAQLGSERVWASRRTCRRGTLRRPDRQPRRNRSLKDRANECAAQIFVWPSLSGSIVECCALESHERIRSV